MAWCLVKQRDTFTLLKHVVDRTGVSLWMRWWW